MVYIIGHILVNSITCLREAELTPQTSASLGLPPPTQAKPAAIPRPGNKSCWSATSVHTHMVYTNTHLISHRADHLIFRSLLSLAQMSVLLTVVTSSEYILLIHF